MLSFPRHIVLAAVLCTLLRQTTCIVFEQLTTLPTGWTFHSTPSKDTNIELTILIAQPNIDQLHPRLAAVSTPGSPQYGQYMDVDDVAKLFRPPYGSYVAVQTWLESNGILRYTADADSVKLKLSVSQANSLLKTSFGSYTDMAGNVKIRARHYSIPDSLVGVVDFVSPVTHFGRTSKLAQTADLVKDGLTNRRRAAPADCHMSFDFHGHILPVLNPDCLKTVYGVDGYKARPSSGSRVGFASFLNQSASFSDLAAFERNNSIAAQNLSVVLVNPSAGATDQPQPPANADDNEANLDSQYIVGISSPLPVTEYITAGLAPFVPDAGEPVGSGGSNEPYLQFYQYLLSQRNVDLPQVMSVSYGDEEQTVPRKYAVRVCNMIGILGLRGVTVLVSSGDEGVGASCTNANGTGPAFNPIFPATCPYVTSVGGTQSFDPEQAWTGSSGGFSSYFKRPWYQERTVSQYLLEHVSADTRSYYAQYVDFGGRGFPDVAAHAANPYYTVYQGGNLVPAAGTSASTPVVAGIVALLNDARLREGKPSLGFLNPLLYLRGGEGFTDITAGQSMGCNGNSTQSGRPVPGAGVIPGAHWNATTGWDPVTGFGTPDFSKLLQIVSSGY